MAKSHRIAGLRISRVAPVATAEDPLEDFWSPKDALPDLEPPEDRLRNMKSQIFASESILLSHGTVVHSDDDPAFHVEEATTSTRLTVYVMNMIVLVMALPVGLALLFYNIMFGENLRTTAHAIALTGMAIALSQVPEVSALISQL